MKHRVLRIALVVILAGGITLAVVYRQQLDAAALGRWVQEAGVAGPIVFMTIYALGTLFFLPGSVLTLAGGALFGPLLGTLYNLVGATVGGTLAFLGARYMASEWVEKKTGRRLKQLKDGIEEGGGWQFVAFVRLVPLFPFNLLNYALGLTRIRLSHYVIASFVCMLPGTFAYTYLGFAGREAVTGGEGLIQKALLALALLAVVAFLPRLVGRLRRSPLLSAQGLRQRQEQGEEILVLDVRSGEDFAAGQGHIAGAVHIPAAQLAERTDEIAQHKERLLAVVCRDERCAAQAARLLVRRGFSGVHILQGGMGRWYEAGYPVERTASSNKRPMLTGA